MVGRAAGRIATRPTPESREITATPTTMLMMAVEICEPNDRELFSQVYRQARCATSCLEPDEWFPLTADVGRREQAARAIAICAGCPVRADCLELSLRHSFGIGAHGVWGGLVAEERRELRRRRLAGVFSR